MAGFETAVAVDIDPDLSEIFETNFPGSKRLLLDLATCKTDQILKACNAKPREIIGVIGGPPCQGFSPIGKREKGDPRNRLIGHFFRHVGAIQPAFFVLENVPGILDKGYRQILRQGIKRVSAKYMIVGPIEFNAWEFGAATRRARAIVIGLDPSRINSFEADDLDELKIEAGKRPTVFEAIHDLPEPYPGLWREYGRTPERGRKGDYARLARALPKSGIGDNEVLKKMKRGSVSGFTETKHTPEVVARFERTSPGRTETISRCPRLTWEKPCTTLRAGTGKDKGKFQSIRPIHPEQDRVITVREAARIQGFPDWFFFHKTKWHSFRMIGNSVSPKLSEALMRFIASRLKSDGPPVNNRSGESADRIGTSGHNR